MIFLGVQDVEQDIGILGGGLGIQQALPRILEILRPDLYPVTPGDVIPEVEDDSPSPFEDIPGLGDDRRGFEVFVEFREPYHEIGDYVEGDMIRGQRPIETGGLRAQVDAEDLLVAALGVAGRDQKQGEKGQCTADAGFC